MVLLYSLDLTSEKFELLHLNGLVFFQKVVCFTGFWVTALRILAFEQNKRKNDHFFDYVAMILGKYSKLFHETYKKIVP